jgi:hypothetical protein
VLLRNALVLQRPGGKASSFDGAGDAGAAVLARDVLGVVLDRLEAGVVEVSSDDRSLGRCSGKRGVLADGLGLGGGDNGSAGCGEHECGGGCGGQGQTGHESASLWGCVLGPTVATAMRTSRHEQTSRTDDTEVTRLA